jgi:hypothetical protein
VLDHALECTCPLPERYPMTSGPEVAAYLRRLAENVEKGEVHHLSLSVHPVPPDLRKET